MAYLTSFYQGTTSSISIPVGTMYSELTLNAFSKVTIVMAESYGGPEVLNKSTVSFDNDGIATFKLTVTNTNITPGKYYYEIFLEHDTNGVDNYDTEYVIESGRVQVKDRV